MKLDSQKVKQAIQNLDDKIGMWQKEVDKAYKSRAREPKKFYKSITKRISHAEDMVQLYKNKKQEILDMDN